MPAQLVQLGKSCALFGIQPEIRPVIDLPIGAHVRVRMRPKEFVQAFIKTPDGIKHWLVGQNDNGDWFLWLEQGENRTVK